MLSLLLINYSIENYVKEAFSRMLYVSVFPHRKKFKCVSVDWWTHNL